MSKHTPGPWLYDYAPGYCGELIALEDGTTLAEFVTEPSEANARLIAAAPDLLDALTDVMNFVAADLIDSDVGVKARAAIAKAKGQV